jgi:hypothetical protein
MATTEGVTGPRFLRSCHRLHVQHPRQPPRRSRDHVSLDLVVDSVSDPCCGAPDGATFVESCRRYLRQQRRELRDHAPPASLLTPRLALVAGLRTLSPLSSLIAATASTTLGMRPQQASRGPSLLVNNIHATTAGNNRGLLNSEVVVANSLYICSPLGTSEPTDDEVVLKERPNPKMLGWRTTKLRSRL